MRQLSSIKMHYCRLMHARYKQFYYTFGRLVDQGWVQPKRYYGEWHNLTRNLAIKTNFSMMHMPVYSKEVIVQTPHETALFIVNTFSSHFTTEEMTAYIPFRSQLQVFHVLK